MPDEYNGLPLTAQYVERDFLHLYTVNNTKLTAYVWKNDILNAVWAETGITIRELKSPCRTKPIVHARWLAIYLLIELKKYSYSKTGRLLNRHHTTIMHGYWKAVRLNMVRDSFAAQVDKITKQLGAA